MQLLSWQPNQINIHPIITYHSTIAASREDIFIYYKSAYVHLTAYPSNNYKLCPLMVTKMIFFAAIFGQ